MLTLSITLSFKITKGHTLDINKYIPLKLSNYFISVMLLTKVTSNCEQMGNLLKRGAMLIRSEKVRTIVISSQQSKMMGVTDNIGLIR